jgi:hypothetical protein
VCPPGTVKVPDELNVPDKEYVGVCVVVDAPLDADEVPFALVAVTVNVYVVDSASPVTEIGEDADDPDPPPEVVNADIALPPVAPAVNVTLAVVVPVAVAAPIVGACGIVVAVISEDVVPAPVPAAFVPVTVKVYETPD